MPREKEGDKMADKGKDKPSSSGTKRKSDSLPESSAKNRRGNSPVLTVEDAQMGHCANTPIPSIPTSKPKQQQPQDDNERTVFVSASEFLAMKHQLSELTEILPGMKNMFKDYQRERELRRQEEWDEEDQDDEEDDLNFTSRTTADVPSHLDIVSKEKEEGEVEDEDEGDEVVAYFKATAGTVKKEAPVINKSFSDGITRILCEGLDKDKKEEIDKKYQVPENCVRLNTMKVQGEIYKNANKITRMNDSHLQNLQEDLTKSITASVQIFEKLTAIGKLKEIKSLMNTDKEEHKELKDLFATAKKTTADVISLQFDVSHNLDIFRRKQFKSEFKTEYDTLCSSDYPVEDSLFGKGLSEKVKEKAEASKIFNIIKATPKYKKGPNAKNSKRPFFGAGGSQAFKRQGSLYSKSQEFRQRQQFQQNNRKQQNQRKKPFHNNQRR